MHSEDHTLISMDSRHFLKCFGMRDMLSQVVHVLQLALMRKEILILCNNLRIDPILLTRLVMLVSKSIPVRDLGYSRPLSSPWGPPVQTALWVSTLE